jgi:hypothetical protein
MNLEYVRSIITTDVSWSRNDADRHVDRINGHLSRIKAQGRLVSPHAQMDACDRSAPRGSPLGSVSNGASLGRPSLGIDVIPVNSRVASGPQADIGPSTRSSRPRALAP